MAQVYKRMLLAEADSSAFRVARMPNELGLAKWDEYDDEEEDHVCPRHLWGFPLAALLWQACDCPCRDQRWHGRYKSLDDLLRSGDNVWSMCAYQRCDDDDQPLVGYHTELVAVCDAVYAEYMKRAREECIEECTEFFVWLSGHVVEDGGVCDLGWSES